MNYVRKLVGGAIAGALVFTTVSLNQEKISWLLRTRSRQRQINELSLGYEADLRGIGQLADAEATAFVDEHREQLIASVKDEDQSEAAVEDRLAKLRDDIREMICLDREARATRLYADQLFELDEGLANQQYWYARLLMALAHQVRTRLREKDLPNEAVIIGL